jgi:hypothetical protein
MFKQALKSGYNACLKICNNLGGEKMEALEWVLDLVSLFLGWGVSVVKNRIATGFRKGRIVVIEVI